MYIESLYIYPIKSCGGFRVNKTRVRPEGPVLDREFMLVDENGKFMSQREHPQLCLIKTSQRDARLDVSIPGYGGVSIRLDADLASTPRQVSVWNDQCMAQDCGRLVSEPFQDFLSKKCSLVRWIREDPRMHASDSLGKTFPVGFADAFPFLIVSAASLADLNGRLAEPVPMDRFRPNIVVGGCEAYEEDSWRVIRIGSLALRFAKHCVRCAIPTTDQNTGSRSPEPLRTLAKYRLDKKLRGITFGSNYAHEGTGTLRVGDALMVS